MLSRETESSAPPVTHGSHSVYRKWRARLRLAANSSLLLMLTTSGCKSLVGKQEKPDLLEAELRTRERELLEARAELQQMRLLTDVYQRQGPVYGQPLPCPPGGVPHLSGSSPFTIRDFQLGNGTGGRDDDGLPGDEGLQVVMVPKDEDGTAVKVPGRATVLAYEITKEGLKLPIGKWEVSAEQLKKTWKSGFLGGGYTVPLQWDRAPTTTRIRVVVRFVLPDGREYEADRDSNVTPLPGLAPRAPTFGHELPPPTLVSPGGFPVGDHGSFPSAPIAESPAATLQPIVVK